MIKKLKKIPVFRNEYAERDFWENHDSTEYVDWSKAEHAVFPNLKLSTQTISLRLPQNMLDNLKVLAHKRDVPYQSYIKVILDERIREEARTPKFRPAKALKDAVKG